MNTGIDPFVVARRLKALGHGAGVAPTDRHALSETFWFVQWRSHQARGLAGLADDLLSEVPECFVTRRMAELGSAQYGIDELLSVIDRFEHFAAYSISARLSDEARAVVSHGRNGATLHSETPRAVCDELVAALTPARLALACQKEARANLAQWLERLVCCDPAHTVPVPPWYATDIFAGLSELMKRHATRTLKRLASTSVVRAIIKTWDYALDNRVFAIIEGGSRFGKTETLNTLCEAFPGQARYIAVPSSNDANTLFLRIARAFFMDVQFDKKIPHLREPVTELLQMSGLLLVADEGHFLIPRQLTKNASPPRLDWFRTEIVDRKVPCVLSYTEQFHTDMKRFIKLTHYNAVQWFGRPGRCLKLAEEIPSTDLLAVASQHLSWVKPALLQAIAGAAACSPNFLKAFEDVARCSAWEAKRNGRSKPNDLDLCQALDDMLPQPGKPWSQLIAPRQRARTGTAPELQQVCSDTDSPSELLTFDRARHVGALGPV